MYHCKPYVTAGERLVLFPKRQLLNVMVQISEVHSIVLFLVTITTRKKLWKCCSKNANLSVNEYIHIEDENNCHTDEDVIELVNREEEMSSEGEAETVEKLETISNRVASISIDTVLYQQRQNLARLPKK